MLILLFLSSMIFATGSREEQGGGGELQRLRLALDWLPNTNHIGAYVAKSLGYFAEEGLVVDIIQPAEATAEVLSAQGRVDFAFSYQEALTFARTSKDMLPIVAIGAVIQHNTSGFASLKPLNSVSDIIGLTYGSWGSPVERAMLTTLLEGVGARLENIRIVNTGSADFFAVMEQGVDFSWVFEGWTVVEARERGIELQYLALADLDKAFDYYTPIIISSEEYLKSNPESTRRFMRALSRGYNYAIQNPILSAAILHSEVPEIPLNLAEASLEFLSKEFIADADRWGEMQKEVWQAYADWLFTEGLIEKPLDTENSFTNEYLP